MTLLSLSFTQARGGSAIGGVILLPSPSLLVAGGTAAGELGEEAQHGGLTLSSLLPFGTFIPAEHWYSAPP